jgi:uncharacterized damage-inducible protein DinB
MATRDTMDLLQHYRQLARYDEWANLEILTSFRAIGSPPARCLRFMAHIVGAEYVWLARLRLQPPPLPVWPDLSVDGCEEHVRDLARQWPNLLTGGSPELLEQRVAYKNSKGEPWNSTTRDILTHVFMHSAYHRGQIAADVRQAGHMPAYTDFIHGVRQGLV